MGKTPAGWTDGYWTSSDGLRLHYRDYAGSSDRPPMFCLHGLTRNCRDFEDFAPRFAGERRVIVPDFRGRGLSAHDPVEARYVPPTYAADIIQLMDVLGLQSGVFVGTSLGGLVTMAIATWAPARIAGAVLNDVGPVLESAGLDRIRGYVGKPALFGSWEEGARALEERNRAIHPTYGAAEWLTMARRLCTEMQEGIGFDYDPAIATTVLAPATGGPVDAWPFFQALAAAPLLVVRGALSDLLSQETAQGMVGSHPDAELVTVPDVGHAPDLSEAEALAAVERLLARVDARANRANSS